MTPEQQASSFTNPFRPGAGHMPPFLAGRDQDISTIELLLDQTIVLQNIVLTGLRGVGKTVLLETVKPVAITKNWLWVGTDLSESTSVTEKNMAIRIMTDISVATSTWPIPGTTQMRHVGFDAIDERGPLTLNYHVLNMIYEQTPGLVSDRLKQVLTVVAECMASTPKRGIVFAYDEAQNLSDNAQAGEYPMSLLLEVFQSLQRSQLPFLLVLTGLPTLFPKLVEARTYAERMFRVVFLKSLDPPAARQAITRPIEKEGCPVRLSPESVETIAQRSGGYPYFIQFICKEVYDAFIQQYGHGTVTSVPLREIVLKLDTDFFAGRWARATDRQRDLLSIIAALENCDGEFTVQEIVEASKTGSMKAFSGSHVSQMLASLSTSGLVYKNRYGKYSFAVPLMGAFIKRQLAENGGTGA